MIRKQLKHLCIRDTDTIANAYWQHMRCGNKCLIIVDSSEKYKGVVANSDFIHNRDLPPEHNIMQIANQSAMTIIKGEDVDLYEKARNIYAEKNIYNIPVISKDGDIIDYFTRERAFYKENFRKGTLPRMHYAVSIMAAANEAKRLGYNSVSVIEFGVAGGNGLLTAQFHAREIERMTEISIKLYGFDLGTGMPKIEKGREAEDELHIYKAGYFAMDEEKLRERLETRTNLVLGNINDTLHDFIEEKQPPVIGALLVDVDTYLSTKYVLDWISSYPDGNEFLPRICMYFDDVMPQYTFVGEDKAIHEFNLNHKDELFISPESQSADLYMFEVIFGVHSDWLYKRGQYDFGQERLKILHRVHNSKYNDQFDFDEAVKLACIIDDVIC